MRARGRCTGWRVRHRDARREPDRDSTRTGELAVQLPVYRMYPVQDEEPADADRRVLAQAYERAVAAVDPADRFALDHVATWLGLPVVRVPRADAAALHAARVAFAQLTAPLAAKGVEDTAHYRYGRLLSRNEVGADAGDFSLSRGAFHARNRHRARTVPHASPPPRTTTSAARMRVRGSPCSAKCPTRGARYRSTGPRSTGRIAAARIATSHGRRGRPPRRCCTRRSSAAGRPNSRPTTRRARGAHRTRRAVADESAARGEASHRLARARYSLRARLRSVRPRDPEAAWRRRLRPSAACVRRADRAGRRRQQPDAGRAADGIARRARPVSRI